MSRDVRCRLPILGSAVPAKARVDLNRIYFHELCQPTTECKNCQLLKHLRSQRRAVWVLVELIHGMLCKAFGGSAPPCHTPASSSPPDLLAAEVASRYMDHGKRTLGDGQSTWIFVKWPCNASQFHNWIPAQAL